MKYQLFAIAPELSVPEVALYGIKLTDKTFDIFSLRSERKEIWWRLDEECGPFRETVDRVFWMECAEVMRKITVDRRDDRFLVVRGRLIPFNLREPEFLKHCRNVLMLEFDRS